MLSKDSFIVALHSIKEQERFTHELNEVCRKYQADYSGLELCPITLLTLIKVLEEVMHDAGGYITWWLYEDVEKVISWEEDGHEVICNVQKAADLYDFLIENNKASGT